MFRWLRRIAGGAGDDQPADAVIPIDLAAVPGAFVEADGSPRPQWVVAQGRPPCPGGAGGRRSDGMISRRSLLLGTSALVLGGGGRTLPADERPERSTVVSTDGRAFHINGKPTYAGRTYKGHKVEGLLFNSRMVQGIFDDLNPDTRKKWDYADGPWDPRRNTREFVAAMPDWRAAGLLSFTINLQGGSPQGYSNEQPWHNSAIDPDGRLRDDYTARLRSILDRADELGMAPILGIFYFGQQHRLTGEAATVRAVEHAVDWVLAHGYRNVMIEVANECDHVGYDEIIKPDRAAELIELVKKRSAGKVESPAGRLLVSTSFTGGKIPPDNVIDVADFLLLHGNGVGRPDGIRGMVEQTRKSPKYRDQPVLFNEDDHFNFDRPDNNMLAALSRYAGWGYFDFRMGKEGYDEGFQSVPVNWQISSARKRGFFKLLKIVTGG